MTRKNKYLLTETLIKTLIIYFKMLLIISLLRLGFEFLNPFETFADRVKDVYNEMLFDVMDGVRSRTAPAQPEDIYIVNVDTASRATIAKMISRVSELKPKVIALDVMFDDSTAAQDSTLIKELRQISDKLVSSAFLDTEKEKSLREMEQAGDAGIRVKRSGSGYQYGTEAFVNFISEPENEQVRYFQPFVTNKADAIAMTGFPVEILRKFSPDKFKDFARKHIEINGNDPEIIVYQRNETGYPVYQPRDILDTSLTFEEFKGKIVLFGYIGAADDLHESPFRDSTGNVLTMNGVIIHANIVEMLLRNETVYVLGSVWTWILSAATGFLLIWGIIRLHHKISEHTSRVLEKSKKWSYTKALSAGPSGIRNYSKLASFFKGLAVFFSFPHFISFLCLAVFFLIQVVLLHRFLIKINTILIAAVIVLAVGTAEKSSSDFMILVHRISDGISKKSRGKQTLKR